MCGIKLEKYGEMGVKAKARVSFSDPTRMRSCALALRVRFYAWNLWTVTCVTCDFLGLRRLGSSLRGEIVLNKGEKSIAINGKHTVCVYMDDSGPFIIK